MKYIYKYCVYFNNCCSGVQFLKAFDKLPQALQYKDYLQSVAGCCDVVKKRFKPGAGKPVNISISNNYRYSDHDLPNSYYINRWY